MKVIEKSSLNLIMTSHSTSMARQEECLTITHLHRLFNLVYRHLVQIHSIQIKEPGMFHAAIHRYLLS